MRPRSTPIALLLSLAAFAIFAYPSTASAVTIHLHTQVPVRPVVGHFDTGPMRVTAMRPVERVVRVAPVDSDQDGIADAEDNCPNTASTVNGGCPPAPTVAAQSVPSVAPPTPVASSVPAAPATTSGGCPSYMAGEASSPTAVNPSSGASGCYQVLPSTAQLAGSACSDVNSTSCVAAICAMNPSDPNAAWASSGATPCDYLGRP